MSDELYDTNSAAEYFHVAPETMRRWRMTGEGPKFVRFGRSVRYRLSALDAFAAAREFVTTTEADTTGVI